MHPPGKYRGLFARSKRSTGHNVNYACRADGAAGLRQPNVAEPASAAGTWATLKEVRNSLQLFEASIACGVEGQIVYLLQGYKLSASPKPDVLQI